MSVRANATCRMLMTMPGIGPITAVAYVAALERPDTFKQSRAVAAWLGLTPRRFQSGEVDYDGHISRRGGMPAARASLRGREGSYRFVGESRV